MAELLGDFESVVSRYYADVYRFALSLTRHSADAADLTQETYLRYAQKGSQLRDASKVKGWLITTVFREFNGRRRHTQRFHHEELDEELGEIPMASPEAMDGLDADAAMQALQTVDEIFRAPLALFYLEDYSYREISEILEIPLGTVMSRLARGKARLKELLDCQKEGISARA